MTVVSGISDVLKTEAEHVLLSGVRIDTFDLRISYHARRVPPTPPPPREHNGAYQSLAPLPEGSTVVSVGERFVLAVTQSIVSETGSLLFDFTEYLEEFEIQVLAVMLGVHPLYAAHPQSARYYAKTIAPVSPSLRQEP